MKINKFIIAGALMLSGVAALAHGSHQEELQNFYKTIESSGLSNSVAKLQVSTIADQKMFNSSFESASGAIGSGKSCTINLDISESGHMQTLTENEQVIAQTQLKNDVQKKMFREFVAAHEHTHCDFPKDSAMNLPFLNVQENAKFNDLYANVEAYGQRDTHINYKNLVNENFADAGAMVLMLKHYGSDNKDLNYVLSVVENQRSDNAIGEIFGQYLEEHFTYSVFDTIKTDLKTVEAIKTQEDFQTYLLGVANKSALKTVMDKDVGISSAFEKNDRLFTNYLVHFIANEISNDKVDMGASKSQLTVLAKQIFDKMDKTDLITYEKTDGTKALASIYTEIGRLTNNDAEVKQIFNDIRDTFTNTYNKAQEYYKKENTTVSLPTTESIMSKIKSARTKYESPEVQTQAVRKMF